MKKFYGACVALLLSLLFVLAGCTSGEHEVLGYVKEQGNFVGNPTYNGGDYTASFTVDGELAYTISISDRNDSSFKNYSGSGTQMIYLGYRESDHEYTSWGYTNRWTVYTHIVKLPEATAERGGNSLCFYLLAETDSKHAKTFSLKLVTANSSFDESNLESIGSVFSGGYALKNA